MGGQAVCDPNTTSSSSSNGAPVSGGLKAAWGLNDPPSLDDGGACEQAKKFTNDFKAVMGPVNKCLQYTKCNAEKAKHESMVAKRDYQYSSFQNVRSQIDPKKEEPAKDKITKFLAESKGVADEANKLGAATEKSVMAWQAKSKAFDDAVHQIEELEGFAFKDHALHRTLATEIQKAVNENKFDDAVAKFGQLDTNLKPAYAEYKKQKEAKEYQEKKWNELKPRIDKLVADKPPIGNACEELDGAKKVMDQAVAQKDWLGAKTHVDQLSTRLEQHEKLYKEREPFKKFYDEKWTAAPLKAQVEKAAGDVFVEGTVSEKVKNAMTALGNAKKQMLDFANAGQFDKAKPILEKLPKLLEDYEKVKTEDKKFYDEKWPPLKTEIDKYPADVPIEEVKTAVAEINKSKTEILGFATASQYYKTRPLLEKLPAALEKLKQRLRTVYEKTWAELKKQLPTSTQKGSAKEPELLKQLLELCTKVESTAASGDYVAALKQIDPVKAKFRELTSEHEAYENQKKDFEKRSADMKTGLDMALATKTDVKEVKATQDAVKAKKTEAEAAAKAGDYAAGITKLNELDAAIKAHQEEEKKKPHKCTWVTAAAGKLSELIKEKYLQADTRIKRAADGYDAALKAQKGAIDAVHQLKQLAVDIAMGVFFAGLGGAAGGAVGDLLKKSVSSGAVIDAGKDVAKWTARTIEKFGGGKLDKDPLAGLPKVGGDGTALARSIGVAINAQAVALGKQVQALYQFVMDNEAKCEVMTVRVEEPNYAAFESDPFLKELGSIANISQDEFQKVFAQALWKKWIEREAYSIGTICSEYDCAKYTVDNFDDFFARLANFRKNVVEQTGQDFGLQEKLDKARAEVQKKVDEMNKN
jgi:hypothetical protein